ncbi:hypothetical protein S40288_08310 [Stachybotrys chartarum IBT 40288]|nr:hypothetical protein S40288_08310 [Stachybotrys chartarum IBT 40288]
MIMSPTDQIFAEFVKAREASKFIDYAFVCEGQRIPVHKMIVCSQSPVFDRACISGFKEADEKFTIDDYSLDTIHRLADYLYTGHYNEGMADGCSNANANANVNPNDALSINATMFALADEYQIGGLQTVSAELYAT